MNSKFQRIARRRKKAFLSDTMQSNRGKSQMEKPSDLFNKIRDSKGVFHAKMGLKNDRSGMG